jgi:hypothetical protein
VRQSNNYPGGVVPLPDGRGDVDALDPHADAWRFRVADFPVSTNLLLDAGGYNPARQRALDDLLVRPKLLKTAPHELKQSAPLIGAVKIGPQECWIDSRDFAVDEAPSFLHRLGGKLKLTGHLTV